jgi:hypothetical protein
MAPPENLPINSKERVLEFFANEVSNYILGDIDRLTNEVRPDEKTGLRGCTVPLAMMVFSVIDLFGYLCRDDKDARKTDTLKNFQYLMSEAAGLFPAAYNDNCEKIVKLFRHGLIHQFFPKASVISKSGLERPLIFENSEGVPTLNVDVLSKDIRVALDKLKCVIAENKNPCLTERINRRLDKLIKEDYEEANLHSSENGVNS